MDKLSTSSQLVGAEKAVNTKVCRNYDLPSCQVLFLSP